MGKIIHLITFQIFPTYLPLLRTAKQYNIPSEFRVGKTHGRFHRLAFAVLRSRRISLQSLQSYKYICPSAIYHSCMIQNKEDIESVFSSGCFWIELYFCISILITKTFHSFEKVANESLNFLQSSYFVFLFSMPTAFRQIKSGHR